MPTQVLDRTPPPVNPGHLDRYGDSRETNLPPDHFDAFSPESDPTPQTVFIPCVDLRHGEFLRVAFGKLVNLRRIESAEVYQDGAKVGLKLTLESGKACCVTEEPYLNAACEVNDLSHELAVCRNRALDTTSPEDRNNCDGRNGR